jgi:hypothetical protein
MNGASEVACLSEVTRCTQQHGRVPVVAASVHAAVVLRRIRYVIGLVDRQRIRAQSDRGSIAGRKHANHARFADIAMNLATELSMLACDKLERAMLFEAKFGACVQVLPPGGPDRAVADLVGYSRLRGADEASESLATRI